MSKTGNGRRPFHLRDPNGATEILSNGFAPEKIFVPLLNGFPVPAAFRKADIGGEAAERNRLFGLRWSGGRGRFRCLFLRRLLVFFWRGLRLRLGLRASFGGVIGDVPSRALELKGRRRKKLFDRALAMNAFFYLGIVDLLEDLENRSTLCAFVFI